MEIDHEIISMAILLPSAEWIIQEGLIVVSYERKYMYVHKLLVNCLFKLAQTKVSLGELTVP